MTAPVVAAIAALTAVAAAPPAQAQAIPDSLIRELQTMVGMALDSVPMPGMAIGIVVDGELAYAEGFGHADLARRSPVTPSTIFQIGSISKSFTATIAIDFERRGLLSLDDRLVSLVAGLSSPDPAITLRHLATHTSGLPGDAPNLRREHGDYPVLAFTHFELYRGLARSALQFPPGEGWGYSNLGYAVLGHALESVSDTPYEVLVERELLAPLGMSSTTATIWPELAPRLATPYALEAGRLVEYTPWDEEALIPAGGLASSLEDLGRYVAFQLEEVQAEGSLAGVHETSVATGGPRRYGPGWFIEEMPGVGRVLSVGGDVDGYVAELVLGLERKLGIVVLTNVGTAGPVPLLTRWLLAGLHADRPAARAEAHYQKGLVHQALEAWEPAVGAFSAAAEHTARRSAALYQVGRTGALSGRFLAEAEAALTAYLDLEPAPGMPREAALWRLGAVLEHRGRCAAAAQRYQAAVAHNPEYGPARAALEALECLAADQGHQDAARRSIRRRGESFSRAYEAGDATALAAFYTEDARLLPPGGPEIAGVAAIREFWGGIDASRVLEHRLTTTGLRIDGRSAVETGRWLERSLTREGGEVVGSGRYMVLWTRGDDGQWRMALDMWQASDREESSP